MKFRKVLFYSPNVERLHRFYTETLGISARTEENSFSMRLQNTLVRFTGSPAATPYHFAINIPGNQAANALEWLEDKVEILPFHGEKLVQFKSWNAESMYFRDPDGNIVEFIARKNLPEWEDGPFVPAMLMEVSEIGVPVETIAPVAEELKQSLCATVFDGDYDEFCALGDDRGLFIIIDRTKKDWIPADDPAHPSPFEVLVEGEKDKWVRFSEGRIALD